MAIFNKVLETAMNDKLIQLVVLAIIIDTIFGVGRAIKERKFNSCFGIDGALRKIGMLVSLVSLLFVDAILGINIIAAVPQEIKEAMRLEKIGVAEFFALLYIAYEAVSILKNMALCGLPVKGIWKKVKAFLNKYTDELPDDDGLTEQTEPQSQKEAKENEQITGEL